MSDPIPALLLIIVTILLPPVGVFLLSGCGADLLVNICLTLLGYIPGHIHAFYLIYIYYHHRSQSRVGILAEYRAPFIFSNEIQNGGMSSYSTSYGTQTNQPGTSRPEDCSVKSC